MASGDPRTTGYASGTPNTYLASREATRTGPGGAAIDVAEVTHGLIGPLDGRKQITTAGTRVALATTTKARYVIVQYAEGSTGIIVVGAVTVIAASATRRGFALGQPGDSIGLEIVDLADVYIDSTVSLDTVTFIYWTL